MLIRHADRCDKELMSLGKEFADEFNSDVDPQVFITPENSQGFFWHFDVEDVFVLQLSGQKEFSLRKNTVVPFPNDDVGGQEFYSCERSPFIMRCRLHAGDWLYIPSGYWHKAVALTESTHISVGIRKQENLIRNKLLLRQNYL
jgi:50S ribosomal protein L16 3-hydroxylase